MRTVYQCDYCGEVFDAAEVARDCEKEHEAYREAVDALEQRATLLKDKHTALQEKIEQQLWPKINLLCQETEAICEIIDDYYASNPELEAYSIEVEQLYRNARKLGHSLSGVRVSFRNAP